MDNVHRGGGRVLAVHWVLKLYPLAHSCNLSGYLILAHSFNLSGYLILAHSFNLSGYLILAHSFNLSGYLILAHSFNLSGYLILAHSFMCVCVYVCVYVSPCPGGIGGRTIHGLMFFGWTTLRRSFSPS